ncbi:MAG TPA: DUF4262 domain-containing protein [Chitinophagales bacterium]|nr:DUF4262 domain-containing protein [Chitinophagales bacterium]
MGDNKDHNCDSPEQLLENTKENIAKFGLQVIMVEATPYLPSFAYSIGLWQTYQCPEIICFGLSSKLGHIIINDVAELIKKGQLPQAGSTFADIFKNNDAQFLNVHPLSIGDYFGVAIRYYGNEDFPALQLIWTDRNNKFPWEDGFEEEFIYKQPLLDRNFEFKFREPKNLTTFSTRQWMDENNPILRVIHDSDGDWQFLTGDQALIEDACIIALEQLVIRDKTLNEVFDLEYGEQAEREYIGGKWTRSKVTEEEEEEI